MSNHRIPWSTVVAYGAPGVGAGYMYLLVGLYVMKFYRRITDITIHYGTHL